MVAMAGTFAMAAVMAVMAAVMAVMAGTAGTVVTTVIVHVTTLAVAARTEDADLRNPGTVRAGANVTVTCRIGLIAAASGTASMTVSGSTVTAVAVPLRPPLLGPAPMLVTEGRGRATGEAARTPVIATVIVTEDGTTETGVMTMAAVARTTAGVIGSLQAMNQAAMVTTPMAGMPANVGVTTRLMPGRPATLDGTGLMLGGTANEAAAPRGIAAATTGTRAARRGRTGVIEAATATATATGNMSAVSGTIANMAVRTDATVAGRHHAARMPGTEIASGSGDVMIVTDATGGMGLLPADATSAAPTRTTEAALLVIGNQQADWAAVGVAAAAAVAATQQTAAVATAVHELPPMLILLGLHVNASRLVNVRRPQPRWRRR